MGLFVCLARARKARAALHQSMCYTTNLIEKLFGEREKKGDATESELSQAPTDFKQQRKK